MHHVLLSLYRNTPAFVKPGVRSLWWEFECAMPSQILVKVRAGAWVTGSATAVRLCLHVPASECRLREIRLAPLPMPPPPRGPAPDRGPERETAPRQGGGIGPLSSLCEHKRHRSRHRGCGEAGFASTAEFEASSSSVEASVYSSTSDIAAVASSHKVCGGRSICEHQRQRIKYKECGVSSICKHKRQRSSCKECSTIDSTVNARGVEGAAYASTSNSAASARSVEAAAYASTPDS